MHELKWKSWEVAVAVVMILVLAAACWRAWNSPPSQASDWVFFGN